MPSSGRALVNCDTRHSKPIPIVKESPGVGEAEGAVIHLLHIQGPDVKVFNHEGEELLGHRLQGQKDLIPGE